MTTAHPALGADTLAAHTAFVRRLARRLTGDDDEADDLTQETLLGARLHPPAADRPLRPWLVVVLRNHFFKQRLAARRRAARERAYAMPEIATPEALLAEVERGRLLAELALELAEPYRQTLLLRYHEPRDRVSVQYGGTLVGTPFAKCLEDEIARTVLAAPVPPPPSPPRRSPDVVAFPQSLRVDT